jgi:hypothetical protein
MIEIAKKGGDADINLCAVGWFLPFCMSTDGPNEPSNYTLPSKLSQVNFVLR